MSVITYIFDTLTFMDLFYLLFVSITITHALMNHSYYKIFHFF